MRRAHGAGACRRSELHLAHAAGVPCPQRSAPVMPTACAAPRVQLADLAPRRRRAVCLQVSRSVWAAADHSLCARGRCAHPRAPLRARAAQPQPADSKL